MNIQKKLAKSFQLFQEKKYEESLNILDQIIKAEPNCYDAYANKAIILLSSENNQQDSKICFEKALSIRFERNIANNFVKLLINLSDWKYAKEINDKLINNYGELSSYKINRAFILRGEKNYATAIDIFKELISSQPNEIDLQMYLGFTLNIAERYEEAIIVYKKIIQQKNNFYPAIYNLAIAFNNAQQFEEAINTFKKSLEINKNNTNAWLTLASAQIKSNKFIDAKKSIENVLKINPHNNIDKTNYANALFQLGLMEITQNNHEDTLKNLNNVLKIDRNHIEANHHLGLAYLKMKNYKKAADYYKYRVRRTIKKYGRFDDFDYPVINLKTSLIVAKEQGIGDELILVRLLDQLSKQVKELVYVCSNKLYKFISENLKSIKVINENEYLEHENNIYKNFTKINLHSIFNYLHNPLNLINKSHNFIVDDNKVKSYSNRFKKDKKLIGLAWMSKNGASDLKKSLKLHDLYPILKNKKNYSYVNLQYGDVVQEINEENKNYKTEIQFDDELNYYDDIYSLAALIKSCDIVITCSGVTAHIAGILGVETYVLVPKYNGKIWYWHEDGCKSSWYKSVTLITQKEPDNWEKSVNILTEYLSQSE